MSPIATASIGRRPDIEADLADRYHVDYQFVRNVATDQFDLDKSLANQARFEALDENTVALYQEGVERGDPFPAVIAHRPGRSANAKLVIIDGNHRLMAHHRAGKPIDVYEVDRSTKGQVIALMTFSFNTRHGRGTSEEERVSQALYLIDNGARQENAAAAVNVPMRVLKRALMKANADRRAAEAGVDAREWDALPQSTKNRLLNITTDEGLIGAVHLSARASLGSDEVFELVALLNTSKSATRQRALIKSETARYQDRIQEAAGGVLPPVGSAAAKGRSVTPKARVGMVLGQILALPEDFSVLTRAYAEGERHEAAVRLNDAAERLRKLAMNLDPLVK